MEPRTSLLGLLAVVSLLLLVLAQRRSWLPRTTLAESVFVGACCTLGVWLAAGNGWLALFVAVVGGGGRALRLVTQERAPSRRDPA
ncbi:MAG: hypothetical protein OXG35_13625 [Acidobacteria bacterium]|nr:hypothetical protein [Acidobacteriota bacterium]